MSFFLGKTFRAVAKTNDPSASSVAAPSPAAVSVADQVQGGKWKGFKSIVSNAITPAQTSPTSPTNSLSPTAKPLNKKSFLSIIAQRTFS